MQYRANNDHVTLKRCDFGGWNVKGRIGETNFLYMVPKEAEALNIYQDKVQIIQRSIPAPAAPKDRVKLGCSPSTKVSELEVKL